MNGDEMPVMNVYYGVVPVCVNQLAGGGSSRRGAVMQDFRWWLT